MAVPSPLEDVKIVCPVSSFVVNTLTLKKVRFLGVCLVGNSAASIQNSSNVSDVVSNDRCETHYIAPCLLRVLIRLFTVSAGNRV